MVEGLNGRMVVVGHSGRGYTVGRSIVKLVRITYPFGACP
jgi:hypothetical protein